MKRKFVALLASLLVDLLLDAFSLVFRLKDDNPGIPVTNFRELAEALACEGSSGTPAIRNADMLGTARALSPALRFFEGRSGHPLVPPRHAASENA